MTTPTNRRAFLQQAGASVIAVGVAPAFLQAAQESKEPAFIESGDWKFKYQHDWGTLPESITWRNTHAVTFKKDGTILIAHQGNDQAPCDTVVAFDADGNYLYSFGKEFAGGMHGMDLREEDGVEYLYLSVHGPYRVLVKAKTDGEIVWSQPAPVESGHYGDPNAYNPTNVNFGPNGEVFVGDGYGTSYIHQYDKDGNYKRTFGGPGELAGQYRTPHSQALDLRDPANPKIVVCDRANARLQFTDLDGKTLFIVQGVGADRKELHGTKGEVESVDGSKVPVTYAYGISYPTSLDIRGENILIGDLYSRLTILDGNNEIVANLGFDEAWVAQVLDGFKIRGGKDFPNGLFVHPHDAAFDKNGDIFVTEWVEVGRITKLTRV